MMENEKHTHVATDEEERLEILPAEQHDRLRSRWETIQGSFIDEPQHSVEAANELVGDLADRIRERFEEQRREIEGVWEKGEEVSTETLRLTLQRYRSFFERLLAV
ncbi:MAG: hypothetical protein ACREMK_10090 [Gemmatimonadota bacterium]